MKRTLLAAAAIVQLLCFQAHGAPVKWKPYLELGKDVYPSLLISTATVDWSEEVEFEDDSIVLGDLNSLFGVEWRSTTWSREQRSQSR